jgi:hypothetical protein
MEKVRCFYLSWHLQIRGGKKTGDITAWNHDWTGNSGKRGQAFRTNGALSPILSVRSTALYR